MLKGALDLLDTATAPTLADFPDDAPASAGPGVWACPLNLPPAAGDSLTQRLLAEIARLRPWAEETRRTRDGRTLIGASGATADEVETMAQLLGAIADSHNPLTLPPETEHLDWSYPMPYLIRHVADDVRILYHEAVAAQPGRGAPDHAAFNTWLFSETVLGEVLGAIGKSLIEVGDRRLLRLRGWLIPEGFVEGDESFGPREPGIRGFEGAISAMRYLRGEEN